VSRVSTSLLDRARRLARLIGDPPPLRTFGERRRAFLREALPLARARRPPDIASQVDFEWTGEGTDEFLGHGGEATPSKSPDRCLVQAREGLEPEDGNEVGAGGGATRSRRTLSRKAGVKGRHCLLTTGGLIGVRRRPPRCAMRLPGDSRVSRRRGNRSPAQPPKKAAMNAPVNSRGRIDPAKLPVSTPTKRAAGRARTAVAMARPRRVLSAGGRTRTSQGHATRTTPYGSANAAVTTAPHMEPKSALARKSTTVSSGIGTRRYRSEDADVLHASGVTRTAPRSHSSERRTYTIACRRRLTDRRSAASNSADRDRPC